MTIAENEIKTHRPICGRGEELSPGLGVDPDRFVDWIHVGLGQSNNALGVTALAAVPPADLYRREMIRVQSCDRKISALIFAKNLIWWEWHERVMFKVFCLQNSVWNCESRSKRWDSKLNENLYLSLRSRQKYDLITFYVCLIYFRHALYIIVLFLCTSLQRKTLLLIDHAWRWWYAESKIDLSLMTPRELLLACDVKRINPAIQISSAWDFQHVQKRDNESRKKRENA